MQELKLKFRIGNVKVKSEHNNTIYMEGKKFIRNEFHFDKNKKFTYSNMENTTFVDEWLLAQIFSKFPDKFIFEHLFVFNSDKKKINLNDLFRSRKIYTLQNFSIDISKASLFVWHTKTYISMVIQNLIDKGFGKLSEHIIFSDINGYSNFHLWIIQDNPKDNIGETEKKYSEIIKQAEKETHTLMLNLAIADGKRK
jgi:hypothetical protein